RRELGESWRQLAASLAPMTLATVALATAGAWLLLGSPSLEATLLRSTFVGLSAVAVPHLALHAFVPSSAATGSATGDVPVVLRGQA
ncbi:MAG: Brp/Blh family beta-carotene 15,15'-dioxygenase, partial [Planctomycetota bacterium]